MNNIYSKSRKIFKNWDLSCKLDLTLCMLISNVLHFLKLIILDPDQVRRFDVGPNCLQMLPADDKVVISKESLL